MADDGLALISPPLRRVIDWSGPTLSDLVFALVAWCFTWVLVDGS